MDIAAGVTTDMKLFNRWLSDLAGTVIETHLRQRRRRGVRPRASSGSDPSLPAQDGRVKATRDGAPPPTVSAMYCRPSSM